jgi:predicted  nucleic acid-binding Zn-ribbon protein
MLEAIKQLLVLQDRDRKIIQATNQLADMAPQRHVLETKATQSQSNLENARNQLKQLEAARKESELEVISLQQRIEKYSLQQYQTKKNDEYRALGHEIDQCKSAIVTQEDQQLDLMEKIEALQKKAAQAAQIAQEDKSLANTKLAELDVRYRGKRAESL